MVRSAEAYRLLLGDRQYVAAAVIIGAAMAALMGYVAGAPFVLQGIYGLDQHQFGLVFGAGGVSLIISGQLNAHLLRRYPPERILRVAVLAGVPTAGWLAMSTATGTGGLTGLLIGLWLLLGVIGMIFPNAPAVAMSRHGERAGSAAALIGGVQFGLGAVGAPLVGLLGNSEAALVAVAAGGMLIAAAPSSLPGSAADRSRHRLIGCAVRAQPSSESRSRRRPSADGHQILRPMS